MPDFKITPLGAGQVRTLFFGVTYFGGVQLVLLCGSNFFCVLGCRKKLYFAVYGWQKYNARLRDAYGI